MPASKISPVESRIGPCLHAEHRIICPATILFFSKNENWVRPASNGWNKLTDHACLCDTRLVNNVSEQDVAHALEILELTLPVTSDTLDRAKRVQLYNWNPTRYSNLTNNPAQYMQAYKKAEEMTKLVEASHSLLSALLVPDESEP
jgi:hypothetical protein